MHHLGIYIIVAAALLTSGVVLLVVYLRHEPATCDCDLCLEMRSENWSYDDYTLCDCARCREYGDHVQDLVVGRKITREALVALTDPHPKTYPFTPPPHEAPPL